MAPEVEALQRRHLRLGWWSLFAFAALGVGLEALHGFKVAWYLAVANETRRLMWTLAHAHGTVLALVHLGFAASLPALAGRGGLDRRLRVASRALQAAALLLPLGFFLGGVWIYEGDPGLGILLVPVGAALLLTGSLAAALKA